MDTTKAAQTLADDLIGACAIDGIRDSAGRYKTVRDEKQLAARLTRRIKVTLDTLVADEQDAVALLRELHDYLPPAFSMDGENKQKYREIVAKVEKVIGV